MPNPAMPKDGLRRLPDHVVAPLLRALLTIPRRPESRLVLRKADSERPPGWGRTADYDVLFRDRRVGRIWEFDYTDEATREIGRYLWHWYWRDADGRKDMEGHAPNLESAMADFRRAWDTAGSNVVSLR